MPAITTLDSQTETLSYLKIEKAINYWSQYKPGAGRVAEQCLQWSDCSRGHSGFRAHAPVSPGGHASIQNAKLLKHRHKTESCLKAAGLVGSKNRRQPLNPLKSLMESVLLCQTQPGSDLGNSSWNACLSSLLLSSGCAQQVPVCQRQALEVSEQALRARATDFSFS